ncbi:MAG: bifunctional nicotinamidase/pyrazinamidase [Planctomycetaceae bacterium]|nr:bifunctional nicotinamidase/pyrazinamidase [Planctomycetaceae bacterium]
MPTLLLVDLQNDFCPGGALGVPEGDLVVPIANRLIDAFELVVATQDWHPADHGSFAANHPGKRPGDVIELDGLEQILWPVHCVQNTPGAEFHPELNLDRVTHVFQKGTDPKVDSYSSFFDNRRRVTTGLADYLRDQGVRRLCLCGLATDYCVVFTALDAVELGFETWVVEDACRGVNLKPGDVDRAVAEMRSQGVKITTSHEILATRS